MENRPLSPMAFFSCRRLTNVIIGNSVTNIDKNAFQSCSSLTAVTIPNSVTNIDDYAFYSCGSLAAVAIPNNVSKIGAFAFASCSSLTAVIIPNSVTNIDQFTFHSCSNLTAVTIPNSVINIGFLAFYSCSSLAAVTIPGSVTSINYSAFRGCSSLASINVDPANPVYSTLDGVLFNKDQTILHTCPGGKAGAYAIPNGVRSIGYSAFLDCNSVTALTMPNSVTNIGELAFASCTNLTNVIVGNTVTFIGHRAFYLCTNLTNIQFAGSPPVLEGSYVFQDTPATIYFLPGVRGWGATFGDRPTAPWHLPYPVILTLRPEFGVRNDAFGFFVSWATNASITVEASTDPASAWTPVITNALTGGWFEFNDFSWTNHHARLYRLSSP